MKKLINDPENFAIETVEGIVAAHHDKVGLLDGDPQKYVSLYPKSKGKVGIVTAGGSGHLPLFLGYVGQGLLDGCIIGNVFASPSAKKMAEVITACDQGNGVLCLYGNYGGDTMNFEMACEMVAMQDIETMQLRAKDDLASSPSDKKDKRRGVAGLIFAYKIAGAAAEKMMSLQEVYEVTRKSLDRIRTIGVALSPCILPQVGKPSFTINDDEIEIGMGIHGEPGIETKKLMTANELVESLLIRLLDEVQIEGGDEVSVMINGLGATPLEEQYIIYRQVHKHLEKLGIKIFMPHIGEFATSMEMAGLSITLFKLDSELKELFSAPAKTPFYTNLHR